MSVFSVSANALSYYSLQNIPHFYVSKNTSLQMKNNYYIFIQNVTF